MRSDRRRIRDLEQRIARLEADAFGPPQRSSYNGPALTYENVKDAYDALRAKGNRFVELRAGKDNSGEALAIVEAAGDMRALRRVLLCQNYAKGEWHMEPFTT